MDQKKLYTILGVAILVLYFIGALIWIVNLQVDIKTQNVRQLNFI